MKDTGKSNLQMVRDNWEEIERKVREHHRKQLRIAAIIVGICVALGITYYVYVQHKLYTDYKMKLEIVLLFNIISWAAANER